MCMYICTHVYSCMYMHHRQCIMYHQIISHDSNVASVRNIPCYKCTKIRFWVKSESSNNLRNKSALYQCLLSVHPAGLRVLSWWRNQVQPLHALVLEGRSLSQHHKHLCLVAQWQQQPTTERILHMNFNIQFVSLSIFSVFFRFVSAQLHFFWARRLAFVATPGGPCRKACQMFSRKSLRRYIPSNGGCTIPRGCKADKQIQHFGGR